MRIRTGDHLLRIVSLILGCCLWTRAQAQAQTVLVNFDGLTGGVQAGNVLSSSGVTFTTGNIPDAVAVGAIITLAAPNSQFEVFAQPANAVSPPNFAAALGAGFNDLLMTFATPVTFVSLRTDHAPAEAPDTVRLLALVSTGNPNEYRVLAIAAGLDNALSAPADTLSVTLGGTPFSAALFQATTEGEGFDDLTFVQSGQAVSVPTLSEWGVVILAGLLALLGVVSLMRR